MNSQPTHPSISTSINVELLDSLDFTPGWEWENPDLSLCEADAVWLGVFTCCDEGFQVCDFHQVHSEVTIAAGYKYHIRCGKEIPHMEWLPLSW